MHDTALGARLKARFQAQKAQVFTTIITAQEVAEGWCAFIRRQKAGTTKQIHGYAEFQHSPVECRPVPPMLSHKLAAGQILTCHPTST